MADGTVKCSKAPNLLLHCLGGSFDGKCSPSVEMPASVWSKLPIELLQIIVAKLPPTSLARFRAVAKLWRDHLSSPAAKKLMTLPVCALNLDFYGRRAGKFGNMVIKLGLSFLPVAYHDCRTRKYFFEDGLVCLSTYAEPFWRFCVCNPMTREYQELPWPPRFQKDPDEEDSDEEDPDEDEEYDEPHVRLCAVATSPLSFRALVVYCQQASEVAASAQVFSSVTGDWEKLWDSKVDHNPYTVEPEAPFPRYLVSNKRVVAAFGINELYFYQKHAYDGLTKFGFTTGYPSEYGEDYHIHRAVAVLEFHDQLYCVEHHRRLNDDDEYLGVEDPDRLTVKIHKLEDQIWCKQAVMPLTIGGRSLIVEESEEVQWDYGLSLGGAAAVSDGICFTVGVSRYKTGKLCDEYHNVVLYHPESNCWELVGHHVDEVNKLFEPRF